MEKTIITVLGKDRVGIIAGVCTFLAEKNVNIIYISQTIADGFFQMMMIVDISCANGTFAEISREITAYGEEKLGVQIKMQQEEIFNSMHRL